MNNHHAEKDLVRRTAKLEKELAAKNHELEIEAALEKVRAKTMAMHKSGDLLEVIPVLAEQFQVLGFNVHSTNVNTDYHDRDWHLWICNPGYTTYPDQLHIPYLDHPFFNRTLESLARGSDFNSFVFTKEEKNSYLDHIYANTVAKNVAEDRKKFTYDAPGFAWSVVYLKNTALTIANYDAQPYTEEQNVILRRFGNVFEQTFTRFLDLQKAEAQAREAQIEAALEKVRSRSLAMHKSEELQQVVAVAFERLRELNISMDAANIDIFSEGTRDADLWIASPGQEYASCFHLPYVDYLIPSSVFNAKEKGDDFFAKTFSFEEKNKYFNYLFEHSDFKHLPESRKNIMLAAAAYTVSFAFTKSAAISIHNYSDKSFSEEENNILKRFARVFEQAYTRFLDLQKAEAQTREAQIEAALEKVRAKVMAMNSSDELNETSLVFGDQLRKLGIDWQFSYFWLIEEDKDDHTFWITWPDKQTSTTTYSLAEADQSFKDCIIAWRNQVKVHSTHVPFENVQELLDTFERITADAGGVALEIMKPDNFKKGVYYYDAMIKFGSFGILINRSINQEEQNIQSRFAVEFERAYTRFLDLQKAEGQAREAKIEAALERVRGKAMAMHSSEDLAATIRIFYHELVGLSSVPVIRCGAGLLTRENYICDLSSVSKTAGGDLTEVRGKLDMEGSPMLKDCYENWLIQQECRYVLRGNEIKKHYQYMRGQVSIPDYPDDAVQHFYFPMFNEGSFYVVTENELSQEDMETYRRFVSVLSLTYKRYNDLMQAEAQARESQIQLALERVRARTMAMQKPGEFGDVINAIGEQFVHLGFDIEWVNFGTNGLNISKGIDIWNFAVIPRLYHSAERVFIPYFDHPVFTVGINEFEKFCNTGEDFYEILLDKKDKDSWLDHLFTKTIYKDVSDELKTIQYPKSGYVSSNITLKDTWLSIGKYDSRPFADEQNAILRRFANAFGQAYTRFLDLQKAEAQVRESQVQLALERVRARTMAMQKSDELPETAAILFEQFKGLGQELMQMTIGIVNEADGVIEFSVTDWSGSGAGVNRAFNLSIKEPTLIKKMYAGWKENKKSIIVDLTGKELENWINYRNKMSGVTVNSADTGGRRVITSAFFSKGHLSFSTPVLPVTESIELLERFAQVFDLTYTRFLDLKQAEELARESQIQLALERVRARTMAMQRSEELKDAASLLFKQLEELGIKSWSSGFNIWQDDGRSATINMCNPDGSITTPYHLPHTEDIFFIRICEARQKGDDLLVMETGGKELEETYNYMFSLPEVKKVLGGMENTGFQIPKFQVNHCAFFFQGYLMFITYEPVPEMWDVFKRFAKVFEQTYTRFLDLQKAEAQARESQIQLALERVRARTMAMQKSEELMEASNLLFQQVQSLGIPVWSCGYNIWEKGEKFCTGWMSTQGAIQPSFRIPLTEHRTFIHMNESRLKAEPFYIEEVSGEELADHYRYMFSLPDFAETATKQVQAGFPLPLFQIHHVFNFKHGNLIFLSSEAIPEAWDIFKRFTAVFEQTYTRFLDLQKAEAQAREAQIEAALERVRSRTMGMQHSTDLQDTALLLFQQILALGVSQLGCGFNIWDEDRRAFTSWMGGGLGENTLVPAFKVPSSDDIFLHIREAAEKGESLFVSEQTGEALETHYKYMFSLPIWKDLMAGFTPPTFQVLHCAYFSQGFLMFISREPVPQAHDIFKRFAKVFEQTYTRFLDLQKAEAQARESQIEAALERVRSRTMGMQKSDELKDVIQVVYKQFVHLNIHVEHTGFIMDYKERNDMHIWLADKHAVPFQVTIPYFDCAHWNSFNESKEKGIDFFANKLSFEEKNKFYQDLFKLIPGLPEETLKYYFSCPGLAISTVLLENIGLYIENFSGSSYSDEENNTLMRFGKVFQQTYTRFLDLQKAEAQAREARIETALEKVRSRTMAMQRSAELAEVATVLFQQVKALGVPQWTCGFSIFEIDDKEFTWYPGSDDGYALPSVKIPLTEHPVFISFNESRKRGDELFVYEKEGEFQAGHYRYMQSLPGMGETLQRMLDAGLIFPTFQIDHVANFSHGNLVFITYEHFPEMHDVFKRFAKVFDQTYTRFLDLQKSEAQARESQIEAALERVRSRTMAMQHSNELAETASMLFQQVKALSINVFACGFNIWIADKKASISWMSNGEIILPPNTMPHDHDPSMQRIYDASKNEDPIYVEEVGGSDLVKHYEYMYTLPFAQGNIKAFKDAGTSFPELPSYQVFQAAFFKQGYLMFITLQKDPEYLDVFKRFAKVFEQTYTRFLDLQKAEAQAREVTKRATVDRVRAEIASMRTTNDLERITPLIWNELTTLGVPFIRCGVFIMDDERQQIETHLSTPDGESLAAFNLSYDAPGETAEILAHWHKKELYKQHWDEAQFVEFTQNLVQQGTIKSGEKYITENHPTDLYLHFLPFLQGMLYAGNTTPLNDDALQLMQNLADAFSTAYARYEDFNKLELAKEQIEKTLVDLKQAQQQLVQSEKMASLGELTAGIAHEIQNPLNFVNNFSDVNKELLEELKEEADKGNIKEIKAIANDVINNEEKINHHGKRADAIVKNMLQHSRSSGATKERTDINKLADEYLRLSYHGLRAKDKSFNADFKTELDISVGKINVISQDIGRVFLNLINNAFYAVGEKAKLSAANFGPLVTISTKKLNDKVEIKVKDNGNGISQKVVDKIFQPFFTTKPTGQGTGLGLSLSYDIIKAHGGEIKVESKEGEGSEFIIMLPV